MDPEATDIDTATDDAPEPKSGLDALNEALAPDDAGGEPEAAATDTDDTQEGADDVDEAAAPEGAEGETEDGEQAGAAPEDGEEAAGGAETPEGEEPGEAKPDGEGAPDPVNDPIPEELKGKTRERMQSLITIAKEKDTAYTEVVQQRNELVGMIQDTGATPQQFGRVLETLKMLHAPDIETRKKGLQALRDDVRSLSVQLGEDTGDPALLERHADLQEAVATGYLDQKYAREIALAREQRSQSEQISQRTSADQEAYAQGKADLDALGQELRDDPDYAAKVQALAPTIQEKLSAKHPSEWARTFALEYAKVKLPPKTPAPKPRAAAPEAQPLRARQPAGGAARQPKDGLDALNLALSDLEGR